MTDFRRRVACLLVIAGTLGGHASPALAGEHWIATWAAAPLLPRPPTPPPAGQPATNQPPANAFQGQTIRMIAHVSLGGRHARVRLSNAFGTAPLQIGAAHIALREKDSVIVAGTDRALTFGGSASIKIPAGADVISDPVDIAIPNLGDVAVSIYLPDAVTDPTMHGTGLHTTYISAAGDFTGAASIAETRTTTSYYILTGIHVMAPADTGVIVAFGDSITDGSTSTPNTDSSWPAQFAKRLNANKVTKNIAVANLGIGGNCVLINCAGIAALARLDRDVLAQPGVKWLIVLEGINDIGQYARNPALAPSAADLIAGYKQIIERAHQHGIKVIGATLTPYGGAAYATDVGEDVRSAVNAWIRSSKAYDAYVDFDKATRDPSTPKEFLPAYNIRDHLHPNDAGYKAMAEAIDFGLFKTGR